MIRTRAEEILLPARISAVIAWAARATPVEPATCEILSSAASCIKIVPVIRNVFAHGVRHGRMG
jgi:hypothetical protein